MYDSFFFRSELQESLSEVKVDLESTGIMLFAVKDKFVVTSSDRRSGRSSRRDSTFLKFASSMIPLKEMVLWLTGVELNKLN